MDRQPPPSATHRCRRPLESCVRPARLPWQGRSNHPRHSADRRGGISPRPSKLAGQARSDSADTLAGLDHITAHKRSFPEQIHHNPVHRWPDRFHEIARERTSGLALVHLDKLGQADPPATPAAEPHQPDLPQRLGRSPQRPISSSGRFLAEPTATDKTKKPRIPRGFSRWRDPDSNWGHHEFQASMQAAPPRPALAVLRAGRARLHRRVHGHCKAHDLVRERLGDAQAPRLRRPYSVGRTGCDEPGSGRHRCNS